MAGFKTHITVSTVIGIGYGATAFAFFEVPPITAVLATGLCSVSGMLPDLDSHSGTPLRESVAFAAAVIPMMLIQRFEEVGLTHEAIVLCGAAAYLLVRFGLAKFLSRCTVHRGMFHSIPAAIIFGEIAFLLASGDDTSLRVFKASAVVLGYMSHLFLDELYSVQLNTGRIRLKSSFGTALKLVGKGWWPNITTFAKLLFLTFVVLNEPHWVQDHLRRPTSSPTSVEQQAENRSLRNGPAKKTAMPSLPDWLRWR